MTIEDKIKRIQAIPKRITELQRNRERLEDPKSTSYDNTGGSSGTRNNSSESKAVNYTQDGYDILKLKKEREILIKEIQAEIDEKLIGESAYIIDMREIVKSKYINGDTLKYISRNVIHRNYTTTKKMFGEACNKLKIALDCP